MANVEGHTFEEVAARYEEGFQKAMGRLPRSTSVINVLQHASGYFSRDLAADEKAFFRSSLERYRQGRIPVSAVTSILRVWVARFRQDYLSPQTFFEPFPDALLSVSDSGKGREL